jgi:hypothetical protein
MSRRAEEVFFQIKDPYLELHESEKFVVKQNELKKDPRFEDTILRNTAYDPYYHKNEFNLSQTQHHKDYIFHPSDTPFVRPEITETFVTDIRNKKGTEVFYPSFLPGSYVDVEEKPRVFESLLVRAEPQAPTEEQIIEAYMKACIKEEQAIAILQNNIQAGLEILSGENIGFRDSFKNYFANLCKWMIEGELKENMNNKVLEDEKGKIEGPEYTYEAITNLPQIHTKIQEIHADEVKNGLSNTIVGISKDVEKEMNTKKKEAIQERLKKQKEEMEREELLKKLKENIARMIEDDRIARQAKLKKIKEMAGIYRSVLRDIKNEYNDRFLIRLKAEKKDIGTQRFTWDSIMADVTLENALQADFLTTLTNQPNEINNLRTLLFEFTNFYYTSYNEICTNITKAEEFYKELEFSSEVDPEDDTNIQLIRGFRAELDKSLNMLVNKRKNISTYNLVIKWYKTLYLSVVQTSASAMMQRIKRAFSKEKIGLWTNGNILYDVPNNKLIFTSRIYDADGNKIGEEESDPLEDINKQDIYYFRVKNEDGEDKTLVFDIRTRKIGKNISVHLQFITRYIDE